MAHDLKAVAWPQCRDVPHWRAEARRFRLDAAEAFAPSMRQKLDIADLYAKALQVLPDTIDGQCPAGAPICPVTLDALLSEP